MRCPNCHEAWGDPQCGCADEFIERREAEITAELMADPIQLREIALDDPVEFGCETYADLYAAMAQLAVLDADKLIGSDALATITRISRLSRQHLAARAKEIAASQAYDEAYDIARGAA